MAKEQKNIGKLDDKAVEIALKNIHEQILHLIAILERMEKRLNGGF